MARKTQKPEPLARVYKPVIIPILCNCTFSPRPHVHTRDNFDAPWNWEKTHKTWAEEAKKVKPSAVIVNGKPDNSKLTNNYNKK